MKNLTYSQLIELAPKDRPFQIEVESNPYGEGEKQVLWACSYRDSKLDTCLLQQHDINGIRYSYGINWKEEYKGTFTLIDPRYQKPEVFKVGQRVKIMESARECGYFRDWENEHLDMIGKTFFITRIEDCSLGVYYVINGYNFPHYCVMPIPVEEEEEEDDVKNDKLTINLVNADNISVKNIVVNYKDKDYKLEKLSDTDKEIIKSKLK
jgi:hypothetical protein